VWERARHGGETCGRCEGRLAEGAPVHVISLPQLGPTAPRRIRCVTCAGQAPNLDELEAFDMRAMQVPERVKGPAVPVSLGSLAKVFDSRAASARNDE
jgi:hypothetical protein